MSSGRGARGRAGARGGSSFRGRGRGARSDYTTVALDYDAAASSNVAASASTSAISTAGAAPARRGRGGGSSTPRSMASAFVPQSAPPRTSSAADGHHAHHGIGSASARLMAARSEAADLLRPVSFIRASTSLAPTFDEPAVSSPPPPSSSLTPSQSAVQWQKSSSSSSPSQAAPSTCAAHTRDVLLALEQAASVPLPSTPEETATSSDSPMLGKGIASKVGATMSHSAYNPNSTSAPLASPYDATSSRLLPPSPSLHETPDDVLFFIDTAKPQSGEDTTFPPLHAESGPANEDQSDTEEVYSPPPKLPASRQTAAAELEDPSLDVYSTRPYAVVLNEPVPHESSNRAMTPLPSAAGTSLIETNSSATTRASTHLSRMVQKKRNKRDARERKKLRKRGRATAELLEEMSLGSRDPSEKEDLEEPGHITQNNGFSISRRSNPGQRSLEDYALQDYVRNLQESGTTSDPLEAISFLRSVTSEHLNSNDLSDIAAIRDEEISSSSASDVCSAFKLAIRDGLDDDTISVYQSHLGDGRSEMHNLAETSRLSKASSIPEARYAGPVSQQDAQLSAESDEESEQVGNYSAEAASNTSSSTEDQDDDELEADNEILAFEETLIEGGAYRLKSAKTTAFDFDAFDESLQKQWQNDRAKKALKRQERYLKRLEAQPTKLNRKKAKRVGCPETSVFSWSSDNVDGLANPDFHRVDQNIRTFIESTTRAELALPPMDKKYRYAIHMLADAYSLKSKSRGTGKDRHNVLYRTMHSSVRGASTHKVHKYLAMTATWDIRTSNNKKTDSKGPNRTTSAPRNTEGRLVGEGADRITSDNIGHQMLAKMGWTSGDQIGRGGGLAEPLSAVVKISKAGLGSGFIRYNRGAGES